MATNTNKPEAALGPDKMVPAAGKHAARPSEADRLEALQPPPAADPLLDADNYLPPLNDPGGAHAKGSGPDDDAGQHVPPEGPIPLAKDRDVKATVHQPEDHTDMPPTGRTGATDYTPNDRMMGSHG